MLNGRYDWRFPMRHLLPRPLVTLPAVLAFVVFAQGPAAPALGANCGDTSGPGGKDVPCHCGDTVTTSTVLKATDPVIRTVCPALGLAVAAGVSLNLGGNTLRGLCPMGRGLRIGPGANTTVTRGRLLGFEKAVVGEGITDSTISLLQISNSCFQGIVLESSHGNTIEKNVVLRTAGLTAIDVEGDENTVQLNRASEGAVGIAVSGTGNVVSRNAAERNQFGGIVIAGTSAVVDRNRGNFTVNGPGIRILGAGHQVSRNFAHGSKTGQSGLSVSATASTISRNCTDDNAGFGILDDTAGHGTEDTANTYVGNHCTGNRMGTSDPPALCN
jgi:parallel beta-helix repeat protein